MTKYNSNHITKKVKRKSKVITKVAMAGSNNNPIAEGIK